MKFLKKLKVPVLIKEILLLMKTFLIKVILGPDGVTGKLYQTMKK